MQPCKGKLTGVHLTKKNKEDKACQGKGSGDLRGFFLAQPSSRSETLEAQVGTPPAPTQLETDRSPIVSHGFNQARGPPAGNRFYAKGAPSADCVLPGKVFRPILVSRLCPRQSLKPKLSPRPPTPACVVSLSGSDGCEVVDVPRCLARNGSHSW